MTMASSLTHSNVNWLSKKCTELVIGLLHMAIIHGRKDGCNAAHGPSMYII
jgi:hypothetical protein